MDLSSGDMLIWTLGVQLGVVTITTLCYLLLGRSTSTREMQLWMFAWLAHLVATGAGFFFVLSAEGQATLTLAQRPLLMTYAAGKALFALLIVRGLLRYSRPVLQTNNRIGVLLLSALAWGVVSALFMRTTNSFIPVQLFAVGTIFTVGALLAWRSRVRQVSLALTIVVGAVGITYLVFVALGVPALLDSGGFRGALEITTLLESTAGLILAFSLLVAVEHSRSLQIEQLNQRLQSSYEKLRQQTDVDPLTGLKNRRGLRQVLLELDEASLIYVDVDRFKSINDKFGHEVGDECLTRTAFELSHAFRPSDHFFRLGGDEFLVVAPKLLAEQARERTEGVRGKLLQSHLRTPPIALSVGIVQLSEETSPDEALREADRRVLRAKQRHAAAS